MTHPSFHIVSTMQSRASITEAGRTRTAVAKTWSEMPPTGQRRVDGFLNGAPCRFVLTFGAGRGAVTKFYAYFEVRGQVWYIDTGDGYLSDGASVDFKD
ncbi:hypothetical protein [Paraburkholderia youngii]|uniref:Uncharacterized protein n=1 Tax=Paraburkholderia youngii TaxID=2782701 RepID=A0A7Y6JZN0_9BURK|nr:hypothetical protein [Paraburkholderia youngii]NUY01690.1 hypothetical protein [Paraburkholderia youngii]